MGGSSGEEMWRYDAEVIMAGKLFETNKKKKKRPMQQIPEQKAVQF
jgi:thiamine monophosphate synthase